MGDSGFSAVSKPDSHATNDCSAKVRNMYICYAATQPNAYLRLSMHQQLWQFNFTCTCCRGGRTLTGCGTVILVHCWSNRNTSSLSSYGIIIIIMAKRKDCVPCVKGKSYWHRYIRIVVLHVWCCGLFRHTQYV